VEDYSTVVAPPVLTIWWQT